MISSPWWSAAASLCEKTLSQLFCDSSARAIVAMLLAECAEAASMSGSATPSPTFHAATASETSAHLALVLATGDLSIPKMGATGFP